MPRLKNQYLTVQVVLMWLWFAVKVELLLRFQ